MNKQVNQDLKNLINWLHPNNICLNVSKTEVVLFKSSRKRTDVPLKLKLNGKILFLTKSGKYLGIIIDENLNWKQQISDITIKLNKANGMLYLPIALNYMEGTQSTLALPAPGIIYRN